jgi:Tir chaperone protein (CesT) family
MALETYARKLGEDLHLTEQFVRTDEGGFKINLSPTLIVTLDPVEDGALFAAEVGRVGEVAEPESLWELLLLANLFGQGTGGAVLSLDSSGTKVRLHQAFPFELPYVQFKEQLEQFVNYAEFWEKELSGKMG